MTVLEPTPDPGSRGRLLRRVSFAATAVALSGAFAFTLSGIATTRGAVRPDGQAAAIAAAHQQRSTDAATGRHHCHHGDRNRGGTSLGSGRV
jgi:hypothetical protein